MGKVIHTSRSVIRKHTGPHRTAHLEGFVEPFHYGIHGGILEFYRGKYGTAIGEQHPATLDHMIAAVAG
jgi:hypothetical protein